MKNILKKKQNVRRPQPSVSRPASPVVRYYRPDKEDSRKTRKKEKTILHDKQDNGPSKFKIFYLSAFKWSGFIAVIVVIVANTTMASTVVGVVNVDGQQDKLYRSKQAYSDGINTIFGESILYKSKFAINTQKFEERIHEYFPEVEDATVVVPLAGRKLQVGLRLVDPLVRLQTNNNKEALLSENGVVLLLESPDVINSSFAKLPSLSIPDISVSQGAQLLTSVEAQLMVLLISEFDGSSPNRYVLKSIEFEIKKREIRVRFDGVPFYAKLTPEREAKSQVGSLVATIDKLANQNKLPQEYIDVRVDDRVFVK